MGSPTFAWRKEFYIHVCMESSLISSSCQSINQLVTVFQACRWPGLFMSRQKCLLQSCIMGRKHMPELHHFHEVTIATWAFYQSLGNSVFARLTCQVSKSSLRRLAFCVSLATSCYAATVAMLVWRDLWELSPPMLCNSFCDVSHPQNNSEMVWSSWKPALDNTWTLLFKLRTFSVFL